MIELALEVAYRNYEDELSRHHAPSLRLQALRCGQTLSQEEIDEILEYGRLTPTSFGLEMWHFHAVVSKEKLKELYTAFAMNRKGSTSGMTVAILVKTPKHLDPDGSFVYERGIRFPSDIDWFIEDYRPLP